MNPNRSTDRLVAEKVMGIPTWLLHDDLDPKVLKDPETGRKTAPVRRFDFYSTSISDAWLVVERMRELGYEFICAEWTAGGTFAQFRGTTAWPEKPIWKPYRMPEAICLAALKALGVEVLQ